MQEATAKLVESLGSHAGTCLAQGSWIFRSQSVVNVKSLGDASDDTPETHIEDLKGHQLLCLQSLHLLASHLAPILDIVFGSEEKEKVLDILGRLLLNVFPYLRSHQRANLPFYSACSAILSALSGYGYTRRAWKKECLELFLDPAFFQADEESLKHWKVIIDNLMAHETTAFKDLLSEFYFIVFSNANRSRRNFFLGSMQTIHSNFAHLSFMLLLTRQ